MTRILSSIILNTCRRVYICARMYMTRIPSFIIPNTCARMYMTYIPSSASMHFGECIWHVFRLPPSLPHVEWCIWHVFYSPSSPLHVEGRIWHVFHSPSSLPHVDGCIWHVFHTPLLCISLLNMFQLSDVDIGGYTVFLNAGISVAPVKVKSAENLLEINKWYLPWIVSSEYVSEFCSNNTRTRWF